MRPLITEKLTKGLKMWKMIQRQVSLPVCLSVCLSLRIGLFPIHGKTSHLMWNTCILLNCFIAFDPFRTTNKNCLAFVLRVFTDESLLQTTATPALNETGVVLTIEEEPAEEEEMSKYASAVLTIQTEIYDFINVHWTEIVFVFYIVLIAAYFVYFAIAMAKSFDVNSEPPVRLLVCTLLVTFLLLLKIFFRMFDSQLNELYNQSVKKRIKSADCARITEWIKL